MGKEPAQSQRERFEETARELGVDLDEEKLRDALRALGISRQRTPAAPSEDVPTPPKERR